MCRRAYRPEVPGCLEGRSLLSGVAGLSAHPVVVSVRQLNRVAGHMRISFDVYARYGDLHHLREDLDNDSVNIPFGRADGLGESIDRIVDEMTHDLAAHVPHAIRSAQNRVFAVIRTGVLARVRAGDVVLR